MVSKIVTVSKPHGLQLQQAGSLAEYSLKLSSKIFLARGDKEVSAKSLLGILSLGITQGSEIEIICDGASEEEDLEKVVSYIEKL